MKGDQDAYLDRILKGMKIKNLKASACKCGGKFIRTRGQNQVCCLVCISLGHRGIKTACYELQHVKNGLRN